MCLLYCELKIVQRDGQGKDSIRPHTLRVYPLPQVPCLDPVPKCLLGSSPGRVVHGIRDEDVPPGTMDESRLPTPFVSSTSQRGGYTMKSNS